MSLSCPQFTIVSHNRLFADFANWSRAIRHLSLPAFRVSSSRKAWVEWDMDALGLHKQSRRRFSLSLTPALSAKWSLPRFLGPSNSEDL